LPGVIESALWLANRSSPRNGFVRIKGWCFIDANWCKIEEESGSAPTTIDITIITDAGRETFENLHPIEARPDVVAAHSGAPPNCGFCFVLPIEGAPVSNELELSFKYRGSVVGVARIDNLLNGLDTGHVAGALKIPAGLHDKLENLLLSEYERAAGIIVKKSQPTILYIDPSFSCNLKCPHCISEHLRSKRLNRPVMKQDMFDHILDIYGSKLICAIFTLWGEPLLNRRLAEFVRAAKRHSIFVEMSTNLSVPLSNERLDDIVSAGIDEIRLSIDGATQENYEKYRVGGSLDLVLDNLRRMVEAKKRLGLRKPVLKWQFLVWPWNRHEIDAACRIATEIGADTFYTLPGDPWADNRQTRPRLPSDEAISLAPEFKQRLHGNRDHRRRNRHPVGCDFLDYSLAINSDGTVHPCCYVVEPKEAVTHVNAAGEHPPFNAPAIVNLRRFVGDLSDETSAGPSPCANCGSLSDGHVPGGISFDLAIAVLVQTGRGAADTRQ
jgi:MoaA/NifB/PqqE/SkfB family radical SAM enzyme